MALAVILVFQDSQAPQLQVILGCRVFQGSVDTAVSVDSQVFLAIRVIAE